tara:strand:- start:352 stop:621 length:270 start_codon:yes stop_codon:yes gene_type:complete
MTESSWLYLWVVGELARRGRKEGRGGKEEKKRKKRGVSMVRVGERASRCAPPRTAAAGAAAAAAAVFLHVDSRIATLLRSHTHTHTHPP